MNVLLKLVYCTGIFLLKTNIDNENQHCSIGEENFLKA